MQTVLSTVLLDVPRAAAIWLALLVIVAGTVTALIVRPGLFRTVAGWRIREAVLPSLLQEAAAERERRRYAEEVATAADRAAATVARLRAEWLAAQEQVEAAWQACEAAEAEVRRLASAAALPRPHTERTPAEYADRERYLHRAAMDAYWRRELSVEQLSDVFARRGWDPRLHPVDQQLVLRRVVRDNLRARLRAAQERERAAWRAVEQAAVAARRLRQEALAATAPVPAEPAQPLLPGIADGQSTATEQTRELPAGTREPVTVPRNQPVVARGRATVPA